MVKNYWYSKQRRQKSVSIEAPGVNFPATDSKDPKILKAPIPIQQQNPSAIPTLQPHFEDPKIPAVETPDAPVLPPISFILNFSFDPSDPKMLKLPTPNQQQNLSVLPTLQPNFKKENPKLPDYI
ncbi:hypothetical protein C1645_787151 [Glomus cerebriforme]|uniref:Uncharacterized protein n=1 Tax=Glomus cerebriforme TaxID=658196 RepID=A0A397SFP7_9GLOM|nr:hypothetical protein C1645_787151 [Glomus cerebriforme]